jgi:hypothetical protein
METALLIGITGVLGGIALGLGVFVLGASPPRPPPPTHLSQPTKNQPQRRAHHESNHV